MSADFVLHVTTDKFTIEDVKTCNSRMIGSKYFDMDGIFDPDKSSDQKEASNKLFEVYGEGELSFGIGEVSFLKAALFEDPDTFIPGVIDQLNDIIGDDEYRLIDDELIDDICQVDGDNNKTNYSVGFNRSDLTEWLNKNKGRYLFAVAW